MHFGLCEFLVRSNFFFLSADCYFHVSKCKFILKNSSSKCWLRFRLFLWWTQKFPDIVSQFLKSDEKCFLFTVTALFFLIHFCPDFFGHLEKRLDKKAKVDFKIHDAISWERNNYNTHIKLIRQWNLVS